MKLTDLEIGLLGIIADILVKLECEEEVHVIPKISELLKEKENELGKLLIEKEINDEKTSN